MSAYLCEDKHFIALAACMIRFATRPRTGSRLVYLRDILKCSQSVPDSDIGGLIADALRSENHASLRARYNDPVPSGLPPLRVTSRDRFDAENYSLAQIAKSISCLEYQSCEHDGWRASVAYSLLEWLRGEILDALPGYDEAAWGSPGLAADRA